LFEKGVLRINSHNRLSQTIGSQASPAGGIHYKKPCYINTISSKSRKSHRKFQVNSADTANRVCACAPIFCYFLIVQKVKERK